MPEPTTLVALGIALFGGSGLKLIEHVLNRKGREQAFEEKLRTELRGDYDRARNEAKEARDETNKLRDANRALHDKLEDLYNKYDALENRAEELVQLAAKWEDRYNRLLEERAVETLKEQENDCDTENTL